MKGRLQDHHHNHCEPSEGASCSLDYQRAAAPFLMHLLIHVSSHCSPLLFGIRNWLALFCSTILFSKRKKKKKALKESKWMTKWNQSTYASHFKQKEYEQYQQVITERPLDCFILCSSLFMWTTSLTSYLESIIDFVWWYNPTIRNCCPSNWRFSSLRVLVFSMKTSGKWVSKYLG